MGLTEGQSRTYLGLPDWTRADALYPMAVTPKRDGQMRRLVALASMLKRDPRVLPPKAELLAAVLAENIPCVKEILAGQGVDLPEDT